MAFCRHYDHGRFSICKWHTCCAILGTRRCRKCKTVTGIAIRFGLKVLIPVTLVITVGSEVIMRLQTSDIQVIDLGSTYLWYAFPVLLLTHIIIVLEASMRSSGDTVTPLLMGAMTIVLNIALNFWLIKGGLGIPAMGVAGAALATTISRLFQVLTMIGYMRWRKHWLLEVKEGAERPSLWLSYRRLALPMTSGATLDYWYDGVSNDFWSHGHDRTRGV